MCWDFTPKTMVPGETLNAGDGDELRSERGALRAIRPSSGSVRREASEKVLSAARRLGLTFTGQTQRCDGGRRKRFSNCSRGPCTGSGDLDAAIGPMQIAGTAWLENIVFIIAEARRKVFSCSAVNSGRFFGSSCFILILHAWTF
jgi:hypothetical protein